MNTIFFKKILFLSVLSILSILFILNACKKINNTPANSMVDQPNSMVENISTFTHKDIKLVELSYDEENQIYKDQFYDIAFFTDKAEIFFFNLQTPKHYQVTFDLKDIFSPVEKFNKKLSKTGIVNIVSDKDVFQIIPVQAGIVYITFTLKSDEKIKSVYRIVVDATLRLKVEKNIIKTADNFKNIEKIILDLYQEPATLSIENKYDLKDFNIVTENSKILKAEIEGNQAFIKLTPQNIGISTFTLIHKTNKFRHNIQVEIRNIAAAFRIFYGHQAGASNDLLPNAYTYKIPSKICASGNAPEYILVGPNINRYDGKFDVYPSDDMVFPNFFTWNTTPADGMSDVPVAGYLPYKTTKKISEKYCNQIGQKITIKGSFQQGPQRERTLNIEIVN